MYLIWVTPSTVLVWLDFALEGLSGIVGDIRNAGFEVHWYTLSEMRASSLLEEDRMFGLALRGVFVIIDRARMLSAFHQNTCLNNSHWDGFTQGARHGAFSYGAFLANCPRAVNFAESWHNSTLAAALGLYYPKLGDAMTPQDLQCSPIRPSRTTYVLLTEKSSEHARKTNYITMRPRRAL